MYSRGRVMWATGIVMVAMMTMTACATHPVETHPVDAAAGSAGEEPVQEEQARPGAVESYLAWLEASRIPDAEAACASLAPELVTRMLAELNATGPLHADSCEEMITGW